MGWLSALSCLSSFPIRELSRFRFAELVRLIDMNPRNFIRRLVPLSNWTFHRRVNSLDRKITELSDSVQDTNRELDVALRQYRELTSSAIASNKAYYLVCEPGYPNYGDELIVGEWLKYLAAKHPDVPVYVDCSRPGPASAILRHIHPHLQVVDTLSRLVHENSFADVEQIADIDIMGVSKFVNDALEHDGVAARYTAGIEILRNEVRSVHFLGGGYMNSMWPLHLARLSLAQWCRNHGIPVIATGLGLMPLQDDALRFARAQGASFTRFTVRDEETYHALTGSQTSQIGSKAANDTDALASSNLEALRRSVDFKPTIGLGPDDSFVNALSDCYADPNGLPDTMVCIQSDLVEDPERLYRHVLDVLKSWGVTRDRPIGVVECMPYVDYPIVTALQSEGYRVAFFPLDNLLRRGLPARPGQRWLTTRFHPHLLAAAKGCSGSFISVSEEYYGVKHHAVLRMGSRWTNSIIGAPAGAPGPGFADVHAPERYSRQIRQAASGVYGG